MKILVGDKYKDKLPFVTSPNILGVSSQYDENGLFSEKIFGVTMSERRRRIALIDLHCRVMLPHIFKMVKRLHRPITDIILLNGKYVFQEGHFVKSVEGENGMSFLLKHWDSIEFPNPTGDRKALVEYIKKRNPHEIFMRYLVVIPPDLRPVSLEHRKLTTLNELYVKIIKLSSVLSHNSDTSSQTFDQTLVDSIIAQIQTEVNNLFDELKLLSKKPGIIRHDLLGKRVDFSGRAVIVPNPKLKPNEIGVSFKIVCKIFSPYIVHQLLYKNQDPEHFAKLLKQYNLEMTVNGITSLLRMISAGYIKKHEEIYEIVKQHATEAIKDKPVVFKRDPVLHRMSIQAAYVKIIDDDVIEIRDLRCGAFNADFDGDQQAIFAPLGEQAIQDAKKIADNYISPANGLPWPSLKNDVYAGIYLLTKKPRIAS